MRGNRVFVGRRVQRGYGLANYFASLFRRALPLFKSGSQYLAKKAIKTGINTIQDISMGANPKQALKRRLTETSDELLDTVKAKIRRKMQQHQRGEGIRRKKKGALKKKMKRVSKKNGKLKKSKKRKRGVKNTKKIKKRRKRGVGKSGKRSKTKHKKGVNDIFKI